PRFATRKFGSSGCWSCDWTVDMGGLRKNRELLLGLDVGDERGDLLVVEATGEAGHLRAEASHDLGVGLEDRLADVVLVDDLAAAVREGLGLAEQVLEARAGLHGAVGGVAAGAAAAGDDAGAELLERLGLALLELAGLG